MSTTHKPMTRREPWRLPAWLGLCLFLAIAAFFLWEEHRAHLLGALPYVLLLLCPVIHLFMVIRNGFPLFGATGEHVGAMRAAGLNVTGTLDELLGQADVVVDCTPKRIAAKNVEVYRRRGVKFILQGGEKHSATGHSFVAESNYSSALDRESTRVVSCSRIVPEAVLRHRSGCPRSRLVASAAALRRTRRLLRDSCWPGGTRPRLAVTRFV